MEAFEMKGNTLGVEATIPIAAALETQPQLKVSPRAKKSPVHREWLAGLLPIIQYLYSIFHPF
jgi:hypothetical protein